MIQDQTAGPADASAGPHADAPDWGAVEQELTCPLCDYNLRGLHEPLCPECGHRFDWRDLTDPRRRKHPWLFEHHPDRNLWSFWKTARNGLQPLRFWRALSPAQPSRPRRLVLYWCIAAVIGLIGAATPYVAVWGHSEIRARRAAAAAAVSPRARARSFRGPAPRALTLDDTIYIVGSDYIVMAAWAVAWPWLTFLTLMIFRISMRRVRVKPIHVLRCVLYSGDSILWAGIILTGLTAAAWAAAELEDKIWIELFTGVNFALLVGLYLLIVIRLGAAYARYLRFDRPWATVIASQIVFLLLVLNQCEIQWGTVTRFLQQFYQ